MYSRGSNLPVLTRYGLVIGLSLVLQATGSAAAATSFSATNGMNVRIHAGDDIAALIQDTDDGLVLRHASIGEVELYRGPEDPRFARTDVTAFEPLSTAAVETALREVHSLNVDLDVDVFVLPSPPVITGCSFARRNAIVLSPAYGVADESTVGSVTVHELGHVLTWAYFDRDETRWDAYLELRGLDAEINGATAAHAWRAREILAEDLRYLFGGRTANAYQAIENAALMLPDAVDGLEGFLRSTVSGSPTTARSASCLAFPNPCNPRTTVEMALPAGETAGDVHTARLEIYDARGHRVAMVRDAQIANDRLLLTWNGRHDSGAPAASGIYRYVAVWDGLQGRGSVTLVK